jgi:hypothetical protein
MTSEPWAHTAGFGDPSSPMSPPAGSPPPNAPKPPNVPASKGKPTNTPPEHRTAATCGCGNAPSRWRSEVNPSTCRDPRPSCAAASSSPPRCSHARTPKLPALNAEL